MNTKAKYRLALVGTQSLRGQEIKRVLAESDFPVQSIEFFDADIEEEYSRLSQFRDEPKVVHRLGPESLDGVDLVFFAADREINRKFGRLADKNGFRAIDLNESFSDQPDIPLVVAGINDHLLRDNPPLVSNPHPVTIILAHLLHPVRKRFGLTKAIAFILQPASAFGARGIEELASQSVSLLSGTSLPTDVFKQQSAFNLLSHTDFPDLQGFSAGERQIVSEMARVMEKPDFPLSLSMVQASLFHTYALMCYLEMETETGLQELKSLLRESPFVKDHASDDFCSVSCISVTGKGEVFIGQVKKEELFPRSFWIWAVSDNLTRGSALNAFEIARELVSPAVKR